MYTLKRDGTDGSTYTVWCEEWGLDQYPAVGVSRKLGTAQTVDEAKKLVPQNPTRDTSYHIVGNGQRWAGTARKWIISV